MENTLKDYQQTLIARYYNNDFINETKTEINKIIDELGEIIKTNNH